MMLHRHFEQGRPENMTTLADLTSGAKEEKEFVSEIFPPEEPVEAPKRRGRPKKGE